MASQILNSEPNNRHPPSFLNRLPRFPCFIIFLLCPLPSNTRATLTRHTKTLLRYSKVAIKIGGKLDYVLALHGWLVRLLLVMIGIGASPRYETGLGCNMDSTTCYSIVDTTSMYPQTCNRRSVPLSNNGSSLKIIFRPGGLQRPLMMLFQALVCLRLNSIWLLLRFKETSKLIYALEASSNGSIQMQWTNTI